MVYARTLCVMRAGKTCTCRVGAGQRDVQSRVTLGLPGPTLPSRRPTEQKFYYGTHLNFRACTSGASGASGVVRNSVRGQGWVWGSFQCTWGRCQPFRAPPSPLWPTHEVSPHLPDQKSSTEIALRGKPARHHDRNMPQWCAASGAGRLVGCARVGAHL